MVSLRELRQEILALPHNNGREFEADVNEPEKDNQLEKAIEVINEQFK